MARHNPAIRVAVVEPVRQTYCKSRHSALAFTARVPEIKMGGFVEFFCVVLVLGLVGLLVWQFVATRKAVDTTSVRSPYDPRRTAQIISSAFTGARGILWTDATGPGAINKRRRGKDRGITMSIDIESHPSGGSEVSMWASQTNVYFGIFANFAGSVNGRKNAIARLLSPETSSN